MTLRLPEEWRVPAAFALLVIGVLVYAASHAWFWQKAHDMVWLAAPLLLVLLALLLRRWRFAWWVFVALSATAVVQWLVDLSSHRVTTGWLLGGVVSLAELGLLLSPPMRRFMRFHGRLAPSPG